MRYALPTLTFIAGLGIGAAFLNTPPEPPVRSYLSWPERVEKTRELNAGHEALVNPMAHESAVGSLRNVESACLYGSTWAYGITSDYLKEVLEACGWTHNYEPALSGDIPLDSNGNPIRITVQNRSGE